MATYYDYPQYSIYVFHGKFWHLESQYEDCDICTPPKEEKWYEEEK